MLTNSNECPECQMTGGSIAYAGALWHRSCLALVQTEIFEIECRDTEREWKRRFGFAKRIRTIDELQHAEWHLYNKRRPGDEP